MVRFTVIFLLFISSISYGQDVEEADTAIVQNSIDSIQLERCEPNYIKRIKTDSCDYVEMSTWRFTELYVAKRNLDEIGVHSDTLAIELDSLRNRNAEIDSSFTAEIDTLRKQKTVLIQSADECIDLSVDLELENIDLIDENEKLKDTNKKLVGTTIGSVILFIGTLIIAL